MECKHYLQDHGVRVGCYFKQNELIQFQSFHVFINASIGGKNLEIPSKRMLLQDLGTEWWGEPPLLCRAVGPQSCPISSQLAAGPLVHGSALTVCHLSLAVKPEAPVNLTIRNMSNNQLQLAWATPYPKARCLEHAVKYKSNKDTSWTVRALGTALLWLCLGVSCAPASKVVPASSTWLMSLQELSVNGDVFSLPSVDYEKYYTFYVRSKINKYCGSTQFWSEWSAPVFWGSKSTSKGMF